MERQNPDEVFCEGRNEEEALQAACDRLGTTPNQVEHEVVESGASGGVLGFLKGRTVRIRVWRKSESQKKLTDLVKGFCDAFGEGLSFQIARVDDGFEVAFETEGSDGLLIGRGGETLAALQHLLSRMAAHTDETLRVHVDVAGYRRRRQDKLRRSARDLADRALGAGREMVTEPLPADERRVVHLALAEDPRVETHAIGEGLTKRVAVSPSSGASPAPTGGRPAERGHAAHERQDEGHRDGGERRGGGMRQGERRRGRDRDGGRGDEARGHRRSGPGSGRSDLRTPADRLRHATRAIEERQRAERADREERVQPPVRSERSERSERGERSERSERHSHPRSGRGERTRRPVPAREPAEAESGEPDRRVPDAPAAKPVAEREAPAATPRSGEPDREGSYFRIPERIGLVTPAPEKAEPEGESEPSEPKPLTFGRRPRADRRRR